MESSSLTDLSNYEKLGCLHEIFVRQANRTPDNIAVVEADGRKLTFGRLNSLTDALAVQLRSLGVGKNKVVGIFMERCIEYTISYIAILKAGGAYFPIEMSYPTSLINSVLTDAEPILICSKSNHETHLNTKIPVINLDDDWIRRTERKQIVCIENCQEEKCTLDDMAYTVYSSGTTGKPKGIQCPHRGAVFSYTWRHLAYPYEEDDREACNIFFVWEMLRPLLKGIPMYIIPDTVIYDPPKLLEFLRVNKITRMLFTPSLIQTVLDMQPATMKESFKFMKQIWLCGEVVTTILRHRIAAAFPWIKILNLYSISECHDVSCADLTSRAGLDGRTYCPAGRIFPGVKVAILDENFNEKCMGDAGEIFIGGPSLAIGYLNRADLNEQKFISLPTWTADKPTRNRWYRTGDWGYLLSDNSLEVVGRCNSMVKIRGYTIEMKAVENALLSLQEINAACVTTVGNEGMDKILVAYVVSTNGKKSKDLQLKLKKQLPFYMIPSQFVFLDKIPIVEATGKIDKKELPGITATFVENQEISCDESMSQTGKSIAQIWGKILKTGVIESGDNFFDLGGHSLLAAIVVSKINELFGTSLSTLDLYNHPTIESLSRKIDTGEDCISNKIDLRKELKKFTVEPMPSDKLRAFWKSANLAKDKFRRGNILLTGAAGYLGSFLLQRLVEDTDLTVYCLIRETLSGNCVQRLQRIMNKKNIPLKFLQTRIVPVSGDITLNKFGLEDMDYSILCHDIDIVIHCAAYVNLVLPYNALYRTNVIGTNNIVAFCLRKKLKPLHYISTSDVFANNVPSCKENTNMFLHVDKLEHGYAQSKWLAEQIVLTASRAGLPSIITRCGNIGGTLHSTEWNQNDMILLMLQGVILSKKTPDIPWQIELTPADFTADVIVKLTTNLTTTFGKVYHLINTDTVDCRLVWSILQKFGYRIESTPYNKWINDVIESSAHFDQLRPLSHLLSICLRNSDYLSKTPLYHRENLEEFLSSIGSRYPTISRFVFENYIRNLIAAGFISPPPPPPPTAAAKCAEIITTTVKMSSPLKDKIALVTGASSGIGYEIAKTLAKAGVRTIGAARNFEKLRHLEDELKSENIENFVPVQMDVTNKDDVFACLENIHSVVGPIEILINNAGVMEYCKMMNYDLNLWLDMVNVNCIGFLNVVAATLPHMKERNRGHIVNITSDAGVKAFPGLAVYSGTKFFQEAVSDAMRQEIASNNIRVSCVEPGDVKSGLHQKSRDKTTMKEYASDFEYLKVRDIADTVLFILSQPSNCAVNKVLIEPLMGAI